MEPNEGAVEWRRAYSAGPAATVGTLRDHFYRCLTIPSIGIYYALCWISILTSSTFELKMPTPLGGGSCHTRAPGQGPATEGSQCPWNSSTNCSASQARASLSQAAA